MSSQFRITGHILLIIVLISLFTYKLILMGYNIRVKDVQGKKGIYEMTVTTDVRATFEYIEDGVLFRNIGSHDETI